MKHITAASLAIDAGQQDKLQQVNIKKPLRTLAAIALAFGLAYTTIPCSAALLTLDIQQPDRIGAPGTTELFAGTITNGTGIDVLTSDLFLNFSGFDASVVSLTQLLGTPDFLIAAGTTSALTNLFDFDLNFGALVPATYFADVVLEDGSNNLSDTVTVSVRTVPEPGSAALVGMGLLAGWLARRRSAGNVNANKTGLGGPTCGRT